MSVRGLRLAPALALLAVLAAASTPSPGAAAAVPPPALSTESASPDISSTYGSGSFGRWGVDGFGLPIYHYTTDELTAAAAAQSELAGSRDAWSQVGNGRAIATAFNHGYTQLWSQDRTYQWMNAYDAGHQHFSGGYGYINTGGHTMSTLYDDRPQGAATSRDFGVGYFRAALTTTGLHTDGVVYAPLGDDPLLLHDVTITNTSSAAVTGSYFEYWDVNPQIQAPARIPRAVAAPVFDSASATLSVTQLATVQDTAPLSLFAAALSTPVSGYDTDAGVFFGSGTRAAPAVVRSGAANNSVAAPALNGVVGSTMFALQSPFSLAPGAAVTLRYAYGYGHPQAIPGLVAKYRGSTGAWAQSERAWNSWLPKASFGAAYGWLSRELEWDAYTVRSGASYDEGCGHHIISQGGYYQYYFGENEAFRDPLQHMLPMIYADPELAREVIRYSAHEQPPAVGQIPYGLVGLCTRFDLGTSDDLDLWLLWSTAEYVLATRDLSLLDEVIPYLPDLAGGGATIWDHLKAAYQHQEQVVGHGAHGEYLTAPSGTTGDWSDFATEFLQLTESNLVTAQAAYIYPRLAEVADLRGDAAFASQLRTAAAADVEVVKTQLGAMGWFARGYSGATQVGYGDIFAEPQAWALLVGAASPAQSARLIAQFRRFLSGVGAPAALHGPSRIGSALTPAAADPGITEHPLITTNTISNNAGWPPGSWYAVDGWMVWAMGELDGTVTGARGYAWDEFLRNTLAAHAVAYPDHWDGVISIDDACAAFYATAPEKCGIGLTSAYNTQIMHQPAYSLFDTLHLAGVTPTGAGYQVVPHLPMDGFDVRFPLVGVAQQPGMLRGYVRPERAATLAMEVAAPPGVDPQSALVWVDGAVVPHSAAGGRIRFTMQAHAGTPADWAVTPAASGAPGSSVIPAPNTSPGRNPALPVTLALGGLMALTVAGRRRRQRAATVQLTG